MKQMMLKTLLTGSCAVLLLNGATLVAQTPAPTATQQPAAAEMPVEPLKALRELQGVKLGMTREEVGTRHGKPKQTNKEMDEFKLEGGDLLTVHYGPQGKVRVIQFYSTDANRAPAWTDVVGEAPVQTKPNGSKFARRVVSAEQFWVSMYQNESGSLTTITLSRQN